MSPRNKFQTTQEIQFTMLSSIVWPPERLSFQTEEIINQCELMEVLPSSAEGKQFVPVRLCEWRTAVSDFEMFLTPLHLLVFVALLRWSNWRRFCIRENTYMPDTLGVAGRIAILHPFWLTGGLSVPLWLLCHAVPKVKVFLSCLQRSGRDLSTYSVPTLVLWATTHPKWGLLTGNVCWNWPPGTRHRNLIGHFCIFRRSESGSSFVRKTMSIFHQSDNIWWLVRWWWIQRQVLLRW